MYEHMFRNMTNFLHNFEVNIENLKNLKNYNKYCIEEKLNDES